MSTRVAIGANTNAKRAGEGMKWGERAFV